MESSGTPMEQKLRLLPWKYQDVSGNPCEQKEEDTPYWKVGTSHTLCLAGYSEGHTLTGRR